MRFSNITLPAINYKTPHKNHGTTVTNNKSEKQNDNNDLKQNNTTGAQYKQIRIL